jgi:uncharacterized protein (DUF58 family)
MIPSVRLVVLVAAASLLWVLAALSPALLPVPLAALGMLLAMGVGNYLRTPGRRSVEVRRTIPPRFSLGHEQQIGFTVINRGRRGATVELRDHVPGNFVVTEQAPRTAVAPGASASVSYGVRSLMRGQADFPAVTLRTSSGIGFVQRQFTIAHASPGRVYPAFLDVYRYDLLAMTDRREEATRIPRTARGHGSDFESLRPYSRGDDLRRIDWKTTAKRGFLVSRTFRVDRGQQLTMLLDAGRFMAERLGDQTRFEHAVNAAVMLGATAQTRGDSVSLACFSNRIESFLPAVKGISTLPRVLEALWNVQARNVESDYWHVFSQVLSRLRKRCLIVLLCEVLDRASSAGLVHSLARSARKHLILAVVLVDALLTEAADLAPADSEEHYRKAAASHVLLERIFALNEMRSHGILVLETTPQRLSADLITRYLAIRKTNVL